MYYVELVTKWEIKHGFHGNSYRKISAFTRKARIIKIKNRICEIFLYY